LCFILGALSAVMARTNLPASKVIRSHRCTLHPHARCSTISHSRLRPLPQRIFERDTGIVAPTGKKMHLRAVDERTATLQGTQDVESSSTRDGGAASSEKKRPANSRPRAAPADAKVFFNVNLPISIVDTVALALPYGETVGAVLHRAQPLTVPVRSAAVHRD
jgi:hypothetical protein